MKRTFYLIICLVIYSSCEEDCNVNENQEKEKEYQKLAMLYLLNENEEPDYAEVSIGEWHYVAVTKSGDLLGKIYIDGELVVVGRFQDNSFNYSQLYLGASFYTEWSSFYMGYLDEIRISNIVREDYEIFENYESNIPFELDNSTIGLWHFDEGQGNVFVNSVSNVEGRLYNEARFETGKFSSALYFDGIDDRGDCLINIPESNVTFEFWMKIMQKQTSGSIIQPYGLFSSNIQIYE